MKTLLNSSMLILILTSFFNTFTYGQVNEKFYQVTDEGAYEFTYWKYDDNNIKGGNHPVTLRTFYLEAKRQGVLPGSMGYKEFSELSVEEQQALIYFSQQDVIAAMQENNQRSLDKMIERFNEDFQVKNSNKNNNVQAEALHVDVQTQPVTGDMNYQTAPFKEEKDLDNMEPEVNSNIPWLVQAITKPISRYKIPPVTNTLQDNIDDQGNNKNKQEPNTPWLIMAITNPGSEMLQNTKAQAATVSTTRNTNRNTDTYSASRDNMNQEPLYVEVTAKDGTIHQFLVGAKTHKKQNRQSKRNLDMPALPVESVMVDNHYNADRKARLLALLSELLIIQDDEIGRVYGKVFPGIGGKLYGTSDAELDEILLSLMEMKEDILADSDENVQDIFNELEALASR